VDEGEAQGLSMRAVTAQRYGNEETRSAPHVAAHAFAQERSCGSASDLRVGSRDGGDAGRAAETDEEAHQNQRRRCRFCKHDARQSAIDGGSPQKERRPSAQTFTHEEQDVLRLSSLGGDVVIDNSGQICRYSHLGRVRTRTQEFEIEMEHLGAAVSYGFVVDDYLLRQRPSVRLRLYDR